MKSPINRRFRVFVLGACVAVAVIVAAETAGRSAAEVTSASARSSSAPLVVWYDAARASFVKAYEKAHPGQKIKAVEYDGDTNGDGTLQSKFAQYNRVGWKAGIAPDVVFDEENYEAGSLGEAPFNALLDLRPYVPKSVLKNFAAGSMSNCTINGKILCLRNDTAADVLWVNSDLYKQFFGDAPVPTTWQGIINDGKSLIANHPGYYVGGIGDPFDADFYLWGNECPLNQVVGSKTVMVNPSSANCTGIANLIDSAKKAFYTDYVFASAFSSNGDAKKIVMNVGPIWYGQAIWGGSSGVPTTSIEAYPPPAATDGAHVTGALGGGLWMAMSHTTQPKAAAAFIQWMTTSPVVQNSKVSQGLPDYVPRQDAYLASLNGVFANPSGTEKAMKTAAGEVWGGWSPVPWSTDAIWGNTITPNLVAGQSFASQLGSFAGNIKAAAQNAGYSVKSK